MAGRAGWDIAPHRRNNGIVDMVTKVGAVFALAPLILAAWWFFGHVAQADEHEKRINEMSKAVVILTDIQKSQATTEQAEAALIARLCRAGKLPEEECP